MYILYTQYQVLHSHTEDSTLDTFHENSDRGSTCGPFLSSLTGGSDRESAEKKFFLAVSMNYYYRHVLYLQLGSWATLAWLSGH